MLTSTSTLDDLRAVPLLAGVRDKELRAIDTLTTELVFPAGLELTVQSGSGHEFFVIVSGSVEVVQAGDVIAELGPGDFFGEMALLDGGPRSATVRTRTTVVARVLGAREFASLVHGHPAVARNMLRLMSERMRAAA